MCNVGKKDTNICPIHVVTFTLTSNLVTDYIHKRRGEAFEYMISVTKIADIKLKLTTRIGHMMSLDCDFGSIWKLLLGVHNILKVFF